MSLFLLSSDNAYQNLLRKDAEAAAARHEVALTIISADNDPNLQALRIREAIQLPADKRPDAILVAPVNEAWLAPEAQAAAELGVGWVLLNRHGSYLPDLRRAHPKLPLFSVYVDQYQIGHIQGRQFKILLPDGGNLLYVQGPLAATSAERRLAGMREELASTGITVNNVPSDWTSLGAQRVTKSWSQSIGTGHSQSYLVGAQNDDMALGALEALQHLSNTLGQPELASIPVTGCDGTPSFGQRLVSECKLAATVVIPSTAGRAVDAIAMALNTGRPCHRGIELKVASFPPLEELAPRARPTVKRE
jgi:ABC-type sugar transport system substrate-binding protein